MARPPRVAQSMDRDVAPGDLPDVPPGREQRHTHDFTLQAVVEMQRSIGELGAKVDRLVADVDSQGLKIDGLKQWQSKLFGAAAVIAATVAIVWTVLNIVPWSRISIDPPAKIERSS